LHESQSCSFGCITVLYCSKEGMHCAEMRAVLKSAYPKRLRFEDSVGGKVFRLRGYQKEKFKKI